MKDVKRFDYSSIPDWGSLQDWAKIAILQNTLMALYDDRDAALSKLAAETLRADTAEAEVERLEDEFDTGEHALVTLKLKLSAAEQRVSKFSGILSRFVELQKSDYAVRGGMSTRWQPLMDEADAALNPKPEAGSHE